MLGEIRNMPHRFVWSVKWFLVLVWIFFRGILSKALMWVWERTSENKGVEGLSVTSKSRATQDPESSHSSLVLECQRFQSEEKAVGSPQGLSGFTLRPCLLCCPGLRSCVVNRGIPRREETGGGVCFRCWHKNVTNWWRWERNHPKHSVFSVSTSCLYALIGCHIWVVVSLSVVMPKPGSW